MPARFSLGIHNPSPSTKLGGVELRVDGTPIVIVPEVFNGVAWLEGGGVYDEVIITCIEDNGRGEILKVPRGNR